MITKGPWTLDETWMLILGPEKQEIAAIHPAQEMYEKRVDRNIAYANANLIAAAPELLSVLKALVEEAERRGPLPIQPGTLNEEQDWTTALRQARAAIAKAEGKL